MNNRPPRRITSDEKEMFLSLKPDDITLELLQNLFADRWDTEKHKVIGSQFETYDEMELKAGEYTNKETIVTNCGLFIVNKFLIEPHFVPYLGYINDTIDKKRFGKIEDTMAYYILEDESDQLLLQYYDFLDRLTWLTFTFHAEICASKTIKSMKPLPKIKAAKKAAMPKIDQAIKDGDTPTIVRIQNDLVKLAEDELKDDPSYELYKSGARGAFDNAYRQGQIMKGPVWNASKGKFDVMVNSLYEGARKEDLQTMANAIVSGIYPKSIGTGECGYLTKKLSATFQSNVLGEKGSDCGTKALCEVTLTKDNASLYHYHYIKEGSNYVRFDPTTESKYIGKTVKMRLPTCCIGKELCNRCAGDRYYMLGIKNLGLTNGRVSNSLLRARMKQAHDATVRMSTLTADELFV